MGRSESNHPAAAAPAPLRGHFYWWVLGLALVLAILFHESLLGGKGLVAADGVLSFPPWVDPRGSSNMLLADQYRTFLPQHEFVYQQFLEGHFPLWNPYLDCGVPNLASSQGALLFPINLLLLPIPPFYAASIAAFLKLFLAGWATMLYLRLLGVSNSGAFLSGVVFSLSGFLIVWLGHPHVNSAIWLPLMFYLVERFFQGVRQRGSLVRVCAGFAIVFGCMLLGGHPPSMIHVTLFTAGYFLFRWVEHRRECLLSQTGLWIGAVLVGGLLAAPAILPFLEYDHDSSESFSSEGLQRAAMHLPPVSFIFYLLPYASGSPVNGWEETFLRLGLGKSLPNFNERTGYVGILPLLFALYAVIRRPGRLTVFFGGAILLCLLVVFGLPPLPAMLGALPVLRAVNHMRLLLVIGFSVAVLAGIGWDQFQRAEPRRGQFLVVAGFWAAMAIALLGCGWEVMPRWHTLEASCRNFLLAQLLMLGGSLLASCVMLLPSFNRSSLLPALVLGWLVTDLLAFASGYNPQVTRDRYYPSTPAIAWLQRDPGSRLIGDQRVLVPNVSQIFGLRDVRGCDFTTVRRYEQMVTGAAGDFDFYGQALSLPKPMQLLAIKYWLGFHAANPDPAEFELVYSNEISIFRYQRACERALAVYDYEVKPAAAVLNEVRSGSFDPRRTVLLEAEPPRPVAADNPVAAGTNARVRIISDGADTVAIAADLPRPGFLLLLDTYFPGWTATVNGEPVPICRADYNFRAVPLRAGKSTVCFAYRPGSFRLGLLLGAMGWLIVGTAFFLSRARPRTSG